MAAQDDSAATRRLISPAVARAAAERGVTPADLENLPGTGAGGRLLVADLPAVARAQSSPTDSLAASLAVSLGDGSGPGRVSGVGVAGQRDPIVLPLDEHQRQRASTALEDMKSSAQLTSAVEVDVTALLQRVKASQEHLLGRMPVAGDVRELLLPSLLVAVTSTLSLHPALNAHIDVEAGTVIYRDSINLGMVVSGPRGDTAAVISDAGSSPAERVAADLARVRLLAMTGTQVNEHMSAATFTLFHRPGVPILFETPPLPQGTSASLALGWVERRPVATAQSEGGFRVAWAGYLCLTYDHRLVDGADAARFLANLSTAFADDASFEGFVT